ncbi:hypothetical protein Tsubulata_007840, partial [Turnera subulata]
MFAMGVFDQDVSAEIRLEMALSINYLTVVQHVLIWISIANWYLFLLVFGALPPNFSTNVYKIFIEALALAPSYCNNVRGGPEPTTTERQQSVVGHGHGPEPTTTERLVLQGLLLPHQ